MDDSVIEYTDENVIMRFVKEKGYKYVLPYSDQSLLLNETLLYITVLQRTLWRLPDIQTVENGIRQLPENICEDLRKSPIVRLICILKEVFYNKISLPNFELFKMKNE